MGNMYYLYLFTIVLLIIQSSRKKFQYVNSIITNKYIVTCSVLCKLMTF